MSQLPPAQSMCAPAGRMRFGRQPLATSLLLLGLAAPAFAQLPPDAGRVLETLKPAPAQPAPQPALIEGGAAAPAQAGAAGVRIPVSRYEISGASLYPEAELQALLADSLGREHSLDELQQLAGRITQHYRDAGYFLARAYLPAQDIRDGLVRIAILEGRVGALDVQNGSRLPDEAARRLLSAIRLDSVVQQRALERGVYLLDDVPGVDARATLKAGAAPGSSDVIVQVQDGKPWDASLEYDNHGSRSTGRHQLGANLALNNPLGYGDRLSAKIQTSGDGMQYGRLGYDLPVGYHGTRASLGYARTHYRLGKDFANLQASGEADVYSASLQHPFIRGAALSLRGSLGAEHKTLNDRQAATATVNDKRLRSLNLGLSGESQDAWAGGGLNAFALVHSRGDLDLQTPATRALDDATARSHGGYAKTNYSAIRLHSLGARTSLYLSLIGQWAHDNLDGAEKMSLGGPHGVRAYPSGEGSGDHATLFTAELRQSLGQAGSGQLQASAFYDAGQSRINKDTWAAFAGNNRRSISGAGLGLAWVKAGAWQVQGNWAFKLHGGPATADQDKGSRLWLSAAWQW